MLNILLFIRAEQQTREIVGNHEESINDLSQNVDRIGDELFRMQCMMDGLVQSMESYVDSMHSLC